MNNPEILLKSLNYIKNTRYQCYNYNVYLGLFNNKYLIFADNVTFKKYQKKIFKIEYFIGKLPADLEYSFVKKAVDNFNLMDSNHKLYGDVITKEQITNGIITVNQISKDHSIWSSFIALHRVYN